jgi:hypothetical protein
MTSFCVLSLEAPYKENSKGHLRNFSDVVMIPSDEQCETICNTILDTLNSKATHLVGAAAQK